MSAAEHHQLSFFRLPYGLLSDLDQALFGSVAMRKIDLGEGLFDVHFSSPGALSLDIEIEVARFMRSADEMMAAAPLAGVYQQHLKGLMRYVGKQCVIEVCGAAGVIGLVQAALARAVAEGLLAADAEVFAREVLAVDRGPTPTVIHYRITRDALQAVDSEALFAAFRAHPERHQIALPG
ncbi:hypothetical protein J2T57_001592 [Natronocella acetinitrilica]|uniref:Uncharacterized protein n=1 Tax=Natronocella acetinitrilica TaxID=414046 RepID=A0AAE3G2F0_9GAMM|nr:hypothetical protein [Natronocella acetinitrilica]MCP1674490.1 hypothetical protein [Natronocella acetinitrilica]